MVVESIMNFSKKRQSRFADAQLMNLFSLGKGSMVMVAAAAALARV